MKAASIVRNKYLIIDKIECFVYVFLGGNFKKYQQIDYLVGNPLSAIQDAYTPGDFVEDIDGFTGAIVRSSKIISAINDALTRGAYKLAE